MTRKNNCNLWERWDEEKEKFRDAVPKNPPQKNLRKQWQRFLLMVSQQELMKSVLDNRESLKLFIERIYVIFHYYFFPFLPHAPGKLTKRRISN